MKLTDSEAKAMELLSDRTWRLSNLYTIKNPQGDLVKFKPNWAQLELLKPHYLNIILKARQLGVTTFHALLFLDTCIFNDNINAAIIADNKDTAREIFADKIKFAYDNLPEWVKYLCPAYKDNVNELRFSNGSIFRVGTSLRGGTLQLLHITEFAKICAEDPKKATEIVTGSLNTVHAGQFCTIESTARGREGYFYDMCKLAIGKEQLGLELGTLDWKFWFFPWWKHPEYILDSKNVLINKEFEEYFQTLEKDKKISLTMQQKAWYVKKAELQGDNMKREYPSTPEEAFETSNEGLYFGQQMTKARHERRICHLPPVDNALTYASWDIGYSDDSAIWIFQLIGNEVHWIDYYENNGEALAHYINWIKKLPYVIDTHFLPHDAEQHDPATGKTYASWAREAGLKVNIIPKENNEMNYIETTRNMFSRFMFDQNKCVKGMRSVEAYRREWNEKLGCYRERPLHDWASHATKALMYGVKAIEKVSRGRKMTADQWKTVRLANI